MSLRCELVMGCVDRGHGVTATTAATNLTGDGHGIAALREIIAFDTGGVGIL